MNLIRKWKAYVFDQFFIKQPRLRLFITRLLYGDRLHEITLFGSRLTVHSIKENGYLRAFNVARHGSLWRDETSSMMALFTILRPGDHFIDAGANIGVYSCTISRVPGVSVTAFEASPSTFERLKINCERHGVKALNVALSDREQDLEFSTGVVSHVFAASSHRNRYHFGPTVTISASRLDVLVDDSRPIIMKLDVEGHELEVLHGAQKLISSGAIHAVLIDASPETVTASTWLEAQGFTLLDPTTFLPPRSSLSTLLALSPTRMKILGIST
jgi:FkbM family methyltransferase